MDSVVANYVKEQCVMGYIYIIKSDNSGGVDEDRVRKHSFKMALLV